MQPLTRVGLARLILLLVCASGVVPARDEYGCRPVRPKCSPIPSDAGAELKCKRCGTSLLDLANDESWKTEPKDPSHCEAMMKDYYNYNEGSDQYYDTSKGALAQCSSSGMLLYDGALECFKLRESNSASTLVSVIGTCITAKSGFYDCLCRHNIDKKQIFALSNCFGRGNVPDMEKCPNKDPTITAQLPQNLQQVRGTKGRTIYVPNGGGNKWGNGRRSTVDDGSDNNVNTASNGRSSDGSNDGHNDGSDDDYVVDDWPPNLDNQFSPLLDVSPSPIGYIEKKKADAWLGRWRVILSRRLGTRRPGQHHHAGCHLLRTVPSLHGPILRYGVPWPKNQQP